MSDDQGWTFTDPISERECALIIPPDGRVFPSEGEPKIGIEHPECDHLADLAIELDAFYCPACRWNGRVSGTWCVALIDAAGR